MNKSSSLTTIVILGVFLFNLQMPEAAAQLTTGVDVIKAMHQKYQDTWYEYLTFEQKTTFYGPGEKIQRTQAWYEAMHIPGSLAIKFDEKGSNNGILFNNNVQYGYANGQMIQESARVHELLVLGFDVYGQPVDSTLEQLEAVGYDLAKMYEDEWQGREVYVVGVNLPDNRKPQFWIDKERLYFVRSITAGRQNTVQEVQFNKYERLGGGWIAPEVIFLVNGQRGLLEEYSKITIPDTLDADIFNPKTFAATTW
ncbi:MAG: hypothetical protein FH748_09370 [Balneolaceae bacterium]|nr:hypothetical protein [Balneolaceae bacterium]